jgi:glc operon protein GlcG
MEMDRDYFAMELFTSDGITAETSLLLCQTPTRSQSGTVISLIISLERLLPSLSLNLLVTFDPPLSVHLSLCLSLSLTLTLSLPLTVSLCLSLSLSLSLSLPVCLPICLFVCLSLRLVSDPPPLPLSFSAVTEENIYHVPKHSDVSLTISSTTSPSYGESSPVPPVLTLEMAKLMCSIAQIRGVELGINIVVSIYDNHGNLKLFERMDSTAMGSIRVSQLKGKTSASFPFSSRFVAEKSARLPGNPYASVPDTILLAGGLPIILRNTHIGSIGVSGASPDMDEQCAQAGINALINHFNNSEAC